MTGQLPNTLKRRLEFEQMLRSGEGADLIVASENFSQLDLSQLHVDYTLSNVSFAYTNAQFLAETVAPVVPSDRQSNKYFVYGFERFRRRNDLRPPGARPKETVAMLERAHYPGEILLDIKFNGEHMYSSTRPHPASIAPSIAVTTEAYPRSPELLSVASAVPSSKIAPVASPRS